MSDLVTTPQPTRPVGRAELRRRGKDAGRVIAVVEQEDPAARVAQLEPPGVMKG